MNYNKAKSLTFRRGSEVSQDLFALHSLYASKGTAGAGKDRVVPKVSISAGPVDSMLDAFGFRVLGLGLCEKLESVYRTPGRT